MGSKMTKLRPAGNTARCDLEISRLFPKTLKDKFNWAMGVEGDWRFEAAEVKKN